METQLLAVISLLVTGLISENALLVRAVIRGDLVSGVHFREVMRQNADLRNQLHRQSEGLVTTAKVARSRASR